jgi:fumarylacetoacetase
VIWPADQTHDPKRRSWIDSANAPGTDFPIQNLPFGIFQRDEQDTPSIGVAIGDQILDLRRAGIAGDSSLNAIMSRSAEQRSALRRHLSDLLSEPQHRSAIAGSLVPMTEAILRLPAVIGDYTDFYASVFHATNVGKFFRPDNPLLPNYKYVPIGYHGRASSLAPSGAPVRRPEGQHKAPNAAAPIFGPSQMLDYELEIGLFVGPGNNLGEPIPISAAQSHFFGLCLLNDWSARDIQAWEYQPLGPFLSKSFATTISPWVVTMEALAPFRVPAFTRPPGDPRPLAYLQSDEEDATGGVDLTLEVWLSSAGMRREAQDPVRLSRVNFRSLYWTIGQLLTHHASNGCNLCPGDLIGSGTISGPEPDSRGSLLELTARGAEPISLPSGELRTFLEDGDEVLMRGYCEREGFVRIGFGECRGIVVSPSGKLAG